MTIKSILRPNTPPNPEKIYAELIKWLGGLWHDISEGDIQNLRKTIFNAKHDIAALKTLPPPLKNKAKHSSKNSQPFMTKSTISHHKKYAQTYNT